MLIVAITAGNVALGVLAVLVPFPVDGFRVVGGSLGYLGERASLLLSPNTVQLTVRRGSLDPAVGPTEGLPEFA